jgi:hypothetical protein
LHRLSAKLLHIPLFGILCRQAEVDCHKGQTAQHSFVDHLAGRRGQVRERQVDQTLGPVVRANDAAEDWVVREGVFFQGEEEVVAVMLQTGCYQE